MTDNKPPDWTELFATVGTAIVFGFFLGALLMLSLWVLTRFWGLLF